jgi:hypothetical protein
MRRNRMKVWGFSNMEIAMEAEKFAFEKVLPDAGFSEIYHASEKQRFLPFDFVAAYEGRRVLIDVNTARSKGSTTKIQSEIVAALRMDPFFCFIKPDFSAYMLRNAKDGTSVLLKEVKMIGQ